jgi:hypothetical protein
MTIDDVCRMAIALATNCGYAVFPCLENKAPAIPGPGGYKHASGDPAAIFKLWHDNPGPLIGVATGAVSHLWVLDIDQKHPEAVLWWQDNHHRLLPTRAYETRSGGIHLHYRDGDGDGVGCTTSRICKGIDTRGDGGYVIHWFAAGFACHDHSPPAPWPQWLRDALAPPPRPAEPRHVAPVPAEAAIAGIVRRLAEAQEGERNAVLFWCACKLAERGIRQGEIETLLIPTARNIGLSDIETRRTIKSAQGRAVA